MMRPRGWFADIDEDQPGDSRWQPCLQLDGLCLPFPMWFTTEAACLDFIRTEVIGNGLLEET